MRRPRFRDILAATIVTASCSQAMSQETKFNLVDTGVLKHNVHGTGIEMRLTANPLPPGGLNGDAMHSVLFDLCENYAPTVIPFVMEKTGITDPDFIAVRVIKGSSNLGLYLLQAYAIENGSCGPEL